MTRKTALTSKERAIDSAIRHITDAIVDLKGWSFSSEEYVKLQQELDQLQMNLDIKRTGCDKAMTPTEWHLEEAADHCRGKIMTEEEWEHYRALWAGVGVVLAHCRPPINNLSEDVEEDDYERAMEFLK